ncbi:CdaR family protein [Planococcus shenhongbingii]|uniref:CdaR family protein n=1 Tax=Planococcus shenhongbingii TaxID=3058398 RepID=UPI00262E8D0E|nr:CdaR family protein [Planococcus sp. N016]WKA58757.1 CdaR family protein [Planococcus sp. N016]
MDKLMDSPWFLRIMALLLAFLLFFSVKADEDAVNSANNGTITEEIEDVELEVFYGDTNLMVSGLPETVDLTISGPTSTVQTARQLKDFTLFVDLRNMTIGEHRVPIQTENFSEQLRVQINPAFVDITIEERVTQEFRIDPEMNERLLREGFVLEEITADPNSVTVTGPKSVIDAISFVKATVTGEQGVNESFTTEARVRVLANDLTKLENVEIEPEVVKVSVEIQEYSKEVPVVIKENGTPPTGIRIDELIPSSKTVRVYGPKNAVDPLNEYVVEVNTGVITPTDTTIETELKAPKGTTSVTPADMTVEAEITVDETVEAPDGVEKPEVSENSSS